MSCEECTQAADELRPLREIAALGLLQITCQIRRKIITLAPLGRSWTMRRKWLRLTFYRSAVFVGVISLITCLQAQAPAPGEVPAPTIRVSTHLVLVDVVVTDKQGKAISGLHPEDFVVEENGKQEKISTFATPAENSGAPAALPPGFYSNRPQYRSPGGPITV